MASNGGHRDVPARLGTESLDLKSHRHNRIRPLDDRIGWREEP
jgi:hypothetical protein